MASTFTINGSVTLDETAGLQTSLSASSGEDNNDQDVLPSSLASSFLARVNAYSLTPIGAAQSASNFISLTTTDIVVGMSFVNGSGGTIPVLGSGPGIVTDLSALDGGTISLFSDPELGSRLVWGVDSLGQKVFAIYLDPAAGFTSASVQMVQFEALDNPLSDNPDDALDLDDFLGVSVSTTQSFSFAGLPSGQNLFGMVGDSDRASGLVVFGVDAKFNAGTGLMQQGSDTINTSQGGGATTIGVDNQMFDAGDAAYFTFVKNPGANFTGTSLDANEADDADNVQFGSLNEGTSAFLLVSQTQGNDAVSLKLTAYNLAGTPTGKALFTAAHDTVATITSIEVRDSSGKLLGSADGVSVNLATGVVSGLKSGYKISWTTSSPFDQVRVDGVTGKFDIGGFGLNQSLNTSTDIGAYVRFEDDGPAVSLALKSDAQVLVDESLGENGTENESDSLGQVTVLGADLFTTTEDYGVDGPGSTASVYSLELSSPGIDSGLVDTIDQSGVSLVMDGADVIGTNSKGEIVLRISIDSTSGDVTLTQYRALVHSDETDSDEPDSPLSIAANAVAAVRTVTDGDDDSASDSADLGPALKFEDDGPQATLSLASGAEIRVDESDDENTGEDESFGLGRVTVAGSFLFDEGGASGQDGPGASGSGYSLTLASDGISSGLVDVETGSGVTLHMDGADVVGRDGEGHEVLRISIDAESGDVTVTLERALEHTNAGESDESLSPLSIANNAVYAVYTLVDGDGDQDSASADLGPAIKFEDDGPTLGPISDAVVDFAKDASVTKSLGGNVGEDPNGSPYTLTGFTESITVNGVELHGVLASDAQSVTYYADSNDDDTYGSTGDTAYYRLSLDQQGAGNYTFDVLVDPPVSTQSFSFNGLPSGQNLFGMVAGSSGGSGLIVYAAGAKYDSAGMMQQGSSTINTSQGGGNTTIGVNNQMFDKGEGAFFTFVKNPVPNFTGTSLDANEADDADNMKFGSLLETKTGFLTISQTQGNLPNNLTITAYDVAVDDSPQGQALVTADKVAVAITDVRVFDSAGNAVTVGVSISEGVATLTGLRAGYRVEWDTTANHDQVLVQATNGKFDIGGFGTVEGVDTPDQLLHFTAKVTDGDGDYATDEWYVGVDGTGAHDDGMVGGAEPMADATAMTAVLRSVNDDHLGYWSLRPMHQDMWM